MKSKQSIKAGIHLHNWKLIAYIAKGGHGEVWTCQDSNGKLFAIKFLRTIDEKSYTRFKDEVGVLKSNREIEGIIPILYEHLPSDLSQHNAYFVMPLAIPSTKFVLNKTLDEIVNLTIEIAKTVEQLHNKKIYHRDIKPSNILVLNSKFLLADFGLVHYPNKEDISTKNEEIGAKWTMAPEMKRESSSADFSKADVYSLAKTLWIFLTKSFKGFDGQYSIESIIELKKYYPEHYISPIDNLLLTCTDNDPEKRPTIGDFIIKLEDWQELERNFHLKNIAQWLELHSNLFPASIPQRVIYSDYFEISKILKYISSFKSLCHVFLPDSGGYDLIDAGLAGETGCIEINFDSVHIIKPKQLIFESFNFDAEWNYFWLELDELTVPVFEEQDNALYTNQFFDEISELSPGDYYSFKAMRDQFHGNYIITKFSRLVKRWKKGVFIICCKRSPYNLALATYDGKHNKWGHDVFRKFIQESINFYKSKFEDTLSDEQLITQGIPTKRRKHIIERQTVHLCGFCGILVTEEGNTLDEETFEYNHNVLKKYGYSIAEQVHGKCCKGKY